MSVYAGPNATSSGLVLHLDSLNTRSYPGSGTTWFDLSGNNNNGTLTNGPTFVSNGFNFDGIDDFINCGDILDSVFVGASAKFTIMSWIYLTSTGNCAIVGKNADSSFLENQRQLVFRCRNQSVEFVWFGDLVATGFRVPSSIPTVPLNTWTHVAVMFDAAIATADAKASLFINGVSVPYTIAFSGGTPVSIQNGTAPLSIGAMVSVSGSSSVSPFSGLINDTRIYQNILTQIEIQQLFQAHRGRFGV